MATHFLTGGTGLLGEALLGALVRDGVHVLALVRDIGGAGRVRDLGGDPVLGDLTEDRGTWRPRVAEAEVVWHCGLPRVRPPLRGHRLRGAARAAAHGAAVLGEAAGDRPVVMASSALVYGPRPGEAVGEDDPAAPVGFGRVALAAERALAGADLRAVRTGWLYGPEGMLADMIRGLRGRRLRITGDGANRMPLLSAVDGAAAMRAALALPAGPVLAAETPVPTQEEVVHHLCAELGVPRPDRLPPRLASLSLGGGLVAGLTASLDTRPGRLADAGWAPADEWRRDLLSRAGWRPPSAPA
jgi:nucleoside-diphosphate-sugar epimerase